MFKRLMRSSLMQALIGGLLALWMTLVKYTTRWEHVNRERVLPILEGGDGMIGLTFHSRFMLLTSAWKRRYGQAYVLISRSRDGNIVAWTCRWLGLKTLRGSARNAAKSSAKGGAEAGRGSLDALRSKGCVVITPDGPRGPRQRIPIGPIRLAKLSGAPIVPCSFATARRRQFSSWDRFVLPLPFGRGQMIWGTPVFVSAEATPEEMEALRAAIEAEMNKALAQADRACGHKPVPPV